MGHAGTKANVEVFAGGADGQIGWSVGVEVAASQRTAEPVSVLGLLGHAWADLGPQLATPSSCAASIDRSQRAADLE
jgi:hypothetical protein